MRSQRTAQMRWILNTNCNKNRVESSKVLTRAAFGWTTCFYIYSPHGKSRNKVKTEWEKTAKIKRNTFRIETRWKSTWQWKNILHDEALRRRKNTWNKYLRSIFFSGWCAPLFSMLIFHFHLSYVSATQKQESRKKWNELVSECVHLIIFTLKHTHCTKILCIFHSEFNTYFLRVFSCCFFF